MSLPKFLAAIGEHSVAEKSRYLVEIEPPKRMLSAAKSADPKSGSVTEIMSMYCTGTFLPESAFNIAQRYTYGMPKPVATTKVNPTPMVLEFYVDRDLKIKRFWDAWCELVYPVKNSDGMKFMLSYPDDYTSTIAISQLDRSGFIVYKARLYNAFPKVISDMKYDSSSSTTPATIQATIEYQYWNEVVVVDQPEVKEKSDRGMLGMVSDKINGIIGSIDQTVSTARAEVKKLTTFSF